MIIWFSSRASFDLVQEKKDTSVSCRLLPFYSPFGQGLVTGVQLIVIKIGSLQQHVDFLLSLLEADLLLEVTLLLLVDVRDAHLRHHELPEDLLEWNETAIAFVNRCAHCINVHHFHYFENPIKLYNYNRLSDSNIFFN